MPELDPRDLIDPSGCLMAIAEHVAFDAPCALLGLVTRGDQTLLAATKLWVTPPHDTRERTHVTEEAMRRLGLKDFERVDYLERPIVVPVVVVDGPCWWSIDVDEVLLGLRYAKNRFQVLTAHPHVVNRHGWYDSFTKAFGTTPSAAFAPQRRRRKTA